MYLIKYKIRSICSRGFGGRAERRDSRTLTDGVGLDGADNRGCFTRVGDGAALKYDRDPVARVMRSSSYISIPVLITVTLTVFTIAGLRQR